MDRQSFVDPDKLESLNRKVYENGAVDREHLLEFLRLIETNDAGTIVREVQQWLIRLHNDPKYDKIVFPQGHIDNVVNDLESYGRVKPDTIYRLGEA